ncbi:MAG: hypothetical protein VR72_11905 [Clostridiaceae bacterium BRH_c20a]|nr:MAG: hypothetical protein VR72_11905 [Clostridiaceae bacterium BRH_c20a]
MAWEKYKYIYLGLLFAFILSSGLSFYWMTNLQPQNKPKISVLKQPTEEVFKVTEETKVILLKKNLVCEKYQLKCSVKETEMTVEEKNGIRGLNLEELQKKYAKENKTIEKSKDIINIISWENGLCSDHKKIWHLGDNNNGDYVAVYYGPSEVKNEGGIYKVTEIPVSKLPLQYQEKVRKHAMEFTQEEELIATLDSFSEYFGQ